MSIDKLVVRGAREHNLKDVSIELPREALTHPVGRHGHLHREGERRRGNLHALESHDRVHFRDKHR